MSTALLQELHQEVRRLYIAGSDLAADDFRLKRLLPQFEQLGERAAVFKRLGEGISALVTSEAAAGQSSAVKLQDLTLLLESVLYTQGSTSPSGSEAVQLQGSAFGLETGVSSRKIAAVRQALTTTGSGRYETVLEAFKDGVFQDLRLLPLAVGALGDPYAELADFAMNKILPSYGPAAADYLAQHFNPAGGKSEVRKLHVIKAVGRPELLEEIYKAACSGSDDVRAAAILCLAGPQEYIQALLEWTADKKKPIREAAYTALAEGGSAEGLERLFEAFAGKKDRELAAYALANYPSAPLGERLSVKFMDELREALAADHKDSKKNEALWNVISPYLIALADIRNPQLDEIYRFIIEHYDRFAALGWLHLLDRAARYQETALSEQGLELLRELDNKSVRYLSYYFRAAQQLLTAKELYNEFAGGSLLDKMKARLAKDAATRNRVLQDTLEEQILNAERVTYQLAWDYAGSRQQYVWEMLSPERIAAEWNPRWLDWAIERDAPELAAALARPGHSGVREYLTAKLNREGKHRKDVDFVSNLFKGLERAGLPEAERQELLISVVEQQRFQNPYMFHFYLLERMLAFPASYVERIEAVLPKYRYESKTQLEYLVSHLRSRQ
ncbi:HEAT repeat domain-containing protein [Paenibacillus typhae]|uniref:HEAT repeat n=1 Tax=Paenibacillus typhae TaxID=1174501 RepID=A0A1G9GN44_9BACL|nr:HEAT repeat domain-containing protein [Paenibacillus typhae]SDL02084.1 HEAT repeat [Paenibacillus typhae]